MLSKLLLTYLLTYLLTTVCDAWPMRRQTYMYLPSLRRYKMRRYQIISLSLASYWPRVTDINGSPPTGSRPRRGRWAPPLTLSRGAWL